MKRTTLQALITLVTIVIICSYGFAEVPKTIGKISEVTVYRGQALVTRMILTRLPQGLSDLIVTDLPERIVPESLYAQTKGDIKVLSVRYRERAVKEDTREEVKKLDVQIKELQRQISHAERKKGHLDNQWAMFIKLRDFTVDAKNTDLNQGLLTFQPINDLVKLIQTQGSEYIEKALAFEDQILAGLSKTEREAVLYVDNKGNDKTPIELSYLVNGATWQPQYNLRSLPANSNVSIEYNAVINQVSGEDWDEVILRLSTAKPSMVAASPELESMPVALGSGLTNVQLFESQRQQIQLPQTQEQAEFDNTEQFRLLTKSRGQYIGKGKSAQQKLNDIARLNQAMVLNLDRRELEQIQELVQEIARIEGVSVTYDLSGRLSLPSRSDQQLVSIASIIAEADFTLIATPILTDYVYLQGRILNDSQTILLPGPASMFRNGEFVGTGQVPLVTIGEQFTGGFGIDSQIQVVRELEDKKTKIQGGNRMDSYNYRIALSNYKNIPVELKLLDRLPYCDNSSIKVELDKTTPALSEKSEYLRKDRKKNILYWDLKLAPNTSGEEATVVVYSFTMEYDRNMQIQPK
jgi:hypothetical protein